MNRELESSSSREPGRSRGQDQGQSDDPGRGHGQGHDRRARQLGQYTILVVTLAAPIAIGGARPGVQVVLAGGAVLAAAVWAYARRGDVRLPPFALVALLGLGFTLFQLLPLPAPLVGLLSPRTLALRSEALGVRPGFLPLTLDVPATWLAAARGLACLAVLVVTAAISKRGKAHLLVAPLVFLGGGMAVLSFLQRWLGAETILGFYEVADLPGSGFFGTFVNGNHAAAFFTIAGLLGWGQARESDGALRVALATSALLSVAGLFATGSRFGIVGAAAGAFLILALWLVQGFGGVRGLIATATAGLLAAPLAYSLALAQRGQSAAQLPLSDFKIRGWLDALDLALGFPVFGVGRGAFEAPATAYRLHSHEQVRLVFPENLPLQMATEWGLPVTLGLIGLFGWYMWPILKRLPRWEPMYQAAAATVLAVLVHDLADFGLELLGVAMPAALALGVLAGRRQMSLEAGGNRSVSVQLTAPAVVKARAALAFVAAGLLVAGAAWAAPRTADADGDKLRAAIKRRAPGTDALLATAIARHPAEHDFALLAARWGMRLDPPDPAALRQLNRAQRLYPASPTPHIVTAHALVRLGRAPQAALELRLANDLGANLAYPQLERMVGRAHLERTIPRDPDRLFALAQYLAGQGRAAEAAAAADRAVLFAQSSEQSLMRRTEIALVSKDRAFIANAAHALARGPTTTQSFELAIRGLAAGGDLPEALALTRQAGVIFPQEGSLTVQGARLQLEGGQPTVARTLVSEGATRNLSVTDRIAGEELLAEIADKEGDAPAAAAARARARILVQLRNQNSR